MLAYCFNIIDKKHISFGLGILLVGLLFQSCNAIFEKDITDDIPELFLPTDNDTIYSNKVHFKWVEMEGASFYNLQIVKPSFENISEFVLDSNINDKEFYQILEPGHYQFRLRGENGAHKSTFAGPYSIYVDSVSDLSSQFVSLVSPVDGIYSNGSSDLGLSWQNLFSADNYEYVLKIGTDFSSGSILDQDLNINTLSYIISASFFDVEGTYFWGIRGTNVTGGTPYSSRAIHIDLTRPNDPNLLSPVDGISNPVDDAITLKWTTGIDLGVVHAPVTCTVEISTSETFDDFVEVSGISSDSLEYTFPSIGNYWWRVKSEDEAGNVSEYYSLERQIIVE